MKTLKILTLATIVAITSGCASFVANNTSNAVGTNSGERSIGQVIIDKSIERTAKINLYKLDARFKQSRINIESFHSNVLLTGQVPDAHLKQLAEENVKAMSDVKTVHNFITVGSQVSYSTIMQDLGVTANTKGLILRAPLIRDSKVLIHTEDAVLYVMGRLNNAEIADLNEVLQKVGNITKIVTLIDNVDEQQIAVATTAPSGQIGLAAATTMPLAETPVAINPDEEQPTDVALPTSQEVDIPASAEP